MEDVKDLVIDDWCLWDGYKPTDFILTSWDILPDLYEQDDIIFEYNQWKQNWSKQSCTLFSAIGNVSDLFNYEFSLDEIKEINDISYKQWRRQWRGWYVSNAVDCVRLRWNSNDELVKKYWKVATYYIPMTNDELINEVLAKKYWICTGYHWSSEYNIDYFTDWILDWDKFGAETYSHAVLTRKVNWKKCIKDNYKWTNYKWQPRNIYEVKPDFIDLVKNKVYFPSGYLFTKVREDNYARIKELNEFKTLLVQTIANNSAMWHKTNDEAYKKKLNEMNNANRKKMADIDEQLKILSV